MRRRWLNFQSRGVLLIWITVGQGPTALAAGAGGGCLDIFTLVYHFSFLSSPLWETARYRLKNCLKGPLSPTQSTNQSEYKVLLARISESGYLIQLLYRKGFHSKICETSRNRCVNNFSDLTCKGIRKGQFNCHKGQSPSGRIRFVLVC